MGSNAASCARAPGLGHGWQLFRNTRAAAGGVRHRGVHRPAAAAMHLARPEAGDTISQQEQAGYGERLPGAAEHGVSDLDLEVPEPDTAKNSEAARGTEGRTRSHLAAIVQAGRTVSRPGKRGC